MVQWQQREIHFTQEVLAQEPEPQEVKIEVQVNWTEERIKEEIKKVFPDAPIMVSVAKCESQFIHYLEDGSVLQGRVDPDDTGVFQINKRYHLATAKRLGLNVDDIQDNIKYARILYDQNGVRDWDASRHCWST